MGAGGQELTFKEPKVRNRKIRNREEDREGLVGGLEENKKVLFIYFNIFY